MWCFTSIVCLWIRTVVGRWNYDLWRNRWVEPNVNVGDALHTVDLLQVIWIRECLLDTWMCNDRKFDPCAREPWLWCFCIPRYGFLLWTWHVWLVYLLCSHRTRRCSDLTRTELYILQKYCYSVGVYCELLCVCGCVCVGVCACVCVWVLSSASVSSCWF